MWLAGEGKAEMSTVIRARDNLTGKIFYILAFTSVVLKVDGVEQPFVKAVGYYWGSDRQIVTVDIEQLKYAA